MRLIVELRDDVEGDLDDVWIDGIRSAHIERMGDFVSCVLSDADGNRICFNIESDHLFIAEDSLSVAAKMQGEA